MICDRILTTSFLMVLHAFIHNIGTLEEVPLVKFDKKTFFFYQMLPTMFKLLQLVIVTLDNYESGQIMNHIFNKKFNQN